MSKPDISWRLLTEEDVINLIQRAARELSDQGLLRAIMLLEAMA